MQSVLCANRSPVGFCSIERNPGCSSWVRLCCAEAVEDDRLRRMRVAVAGAFGALGIALLLAFVWATVRRERQRRNKSASEAALQVQLSAPMSPLSSASPKGAGECLC
jgi:hypothetical protein